MGKNVVMNTTNLWKLLQDGGIRIPAIQRDYAQGRAGKEDLRKSFLNDIKAKLNSKDVMTLDFVYGTVNDRRRMAPLDGQQRLTTIWLLMWYYLIRSESDDRKAKVETLGEFTYETRQSSSDFISWLCYEADAHSDNIYKQRNGLSEYLQGLTTFHSEWKQDPTVQAILRMISGTFREINKIKAEGNGDGIEQVFGDNPDSLSRLFDNDNNPIQFYYLPLDGIQQSDILYVKMNARGEQLTGFENFRADLIDYLQKDQGLKDYVDLGNKKCILQKWDKEWTGIFWKHKDVVGEKQPDKVDDLFFAFITRYLLNRYLIEKDDVTENDATYKLLSEETLNYTSFEPYRDLFSEECLSDLSIILDKAEELESIDLDIPLLHAKVTNLRLALLPQYDEKNVVDELFRVKGATRQEMVLMYGICSYLTKCGTFQKDNYLHWLRVLTNLAYYDEIPSFDVFTARLRFVKEIVKNLTTSPDKSNLDFPDVYDEITGLFKLENQLNTKKDKNNLQLKEEIRKLRLIKMSFVKENNMKDLESLWIFSGHIDCLCDLVDDKLDCEQMYNKLKDIVGIKKTTYLHEDNIIQLFQAVLAKSNSLPDEMLVNDQHDNLRNLLNDQDKLRVGFKDVIKALIRDQKTLTDIIDNYPYFMGDWKYALIRDKSLWKYSRTGKLKKYDNVHYFFIGSYKNDADIPLVRYGEYLNYYYNQQNAFPNAISYLSKKEWKVTFPNSSYKFTI